MKLLILLVSFVVFASASDYEQWQDFKGKFSKSHDLSEDDQRYKIFQSNLRKIEYHNERYEKGEVSYFLKITEFADRTSEEFQELMKVQIATEPNVKPIGTFKSELNFSRPDSIDWREKNAVTKVKNQQACGAWAFSATGSLEGQLAIHRNEQISLSEQELVSCSIGSCSTGWLDYSFDYVVHNGLSSEEQYTYEAVDDECEKGLTDKPINSIQGYIIVNRNEEGIAEAVATVGPISIYVNADSDWQFYGGGIFDHETCDDAYNHAALIVGYDSQAWTIKNSWGENWGENGYLRLVQGKNQCAITTFPVYPLL